jgi:hypothetical protein
VVLVLELLVFIDGVVVVVVVAQLLKSNSFLNDSCNNTAIIADKSLLFFDCFCDDEKFDTTPVSSLFLLSSSLFL